MYVLFWVFYLIVSFCVLFVCKCVLYYCHWVSNPIAVNKYIIKYFSFFPLSETEVYGLFSAI